MKKKLKAGYEWEYETIDDGQFGQRRIKTGRQISKDAHGYVSEHCCDWTGSSTCPGCIEEAKKRNNLRTPSSTV